MRRKLPYEFNIIRGATPPKVEGRGCKAGIGVNINLLKRMEPGDSIWEVPVRKMRSIKDTATRYGIRLKIRKIPKEYASLKDLKYCIFMVSKPN